MNHLLDGSPGTAGEEVPGPVVLGFLAGAAIVRRSAFLAAGGFSAVLRFVGEEALPAYDLAAVGWRTCYVREVVSHHHPSAHRMPTPARRARELRNAALTTIMRRPAADGARAVGRLAAAAVRDPAATRATAQLAAEVERQIRTLEAADAGC